MSLPRVVGLACCFVVGLVACTTDPVDENHQGTLDDSDLVHPSDGSRYDEYVISAKAGWQIDVAMTSAAFDSFVQVRRQGIDDSDFLQENDDGAPPSLDSMLSFVAPASGKYLIWANSTSNNKAGAYELKIQAKPAK